MASRVTRYLFRFGQTLTLNPSHKATGNQIAFPYLRRHVHSDAGNQRQILETSRRAFKSGKTLPHEFRLKQLSGLLQMLNECKEEMLVAGHEDFRKPRFEAQLYELELLRAEIKNLERNMSFYSKPTRLPFNFLTFLDWGYVQREPYGVALILGAWNYPFTLSIGPLAGAIAAGNCAILKPSEVAPKAAATMARILPKYLDQECYHVIEGSVDETKSLLNNRFDYIFATGSVSMGKSVMAAAAPHLTPVTLELGGKSPVYIDESADLELVAKRLVWGKCMNLGQTCIAPDYVLCSKKIEAELIKVATKMIPEWYGAEPTKSPDLCRMVNERNFHRVQNLLKTTKGKVALGGKMDEGSRWISPTLIVDVQPDDPIMAEEIFGPVLPILTVNSSDDAIRLILSKEKPLALYVFTKEHAVVEKFLAETSSGGVCVNDVLWQYGWEGLPFGGVGNSGIGNYHGRYSFDTFSHKRAVLRREISGLSELMGAARYPPYTAAKMKFLTFVLRYVHVFDVNTVKFMTQIFPGLSGMGMFFLMTYIHNNWW